MKSAIGRLSGRTAARWLGAVLDGVDRLLAPLHRSAASVSLTRVDALAMAMLWAIAAAYIWYATSFFFNDVWAHPFRLVDSRPISSLDIYHDSDIPCIMDLFLGRDLENLQYHPTVNTHPLFLSMVHLPSRFVRAMFEDPLFGARIVFLGIVPLTSAALYALARGIGVQPLPSVLATASALSTAAFTHWAGVPETYSLAFLTIAVPFALLATSSTWNTPVWAAVMALSGSITVTNWTAGGLAVLARFPIPESLMIAAIAVSVILILQSIEAYWFKHKRMVLSKNFYYDLSKILGFSNFPLPYRLQDHQVRTLFTDAPFLWSDRLNNLLIFAAVAPIPRVRGVAMKNASVGRMVSFYDLPLAALGRVGGTGACAWVGLCVLGLWSALRSPRRDVAFATIGFLLFHVSLHLAFGETPFLYVLHSLPSFAALITFAVAGPHERLAVALALIFIAAAAPTNVLRFVESANLATDLLTARIDLRARSALGDY